MRFMFGNNEAAKYVASVEEVMIVGFNTLYEGVLQLDLLPPNNLGAIDEYDFDLRYFNFILGDDYRFLQMFWIPLYIFNGYDVFIVSDRYMPNSTWEDNLIESFLKILQSRYGFVACLINSPEDFANAADTDFDIRFGVQNMDGDYKRYVDICKRIGRDVYGFDGSTVH